MQPRGSSFSWSFMHKHNIIQYTKLVNIKHFIFSKKMRCMFEFGYSGLWNVCHHMLYLRSWYRCEPISHLGDAFALYIKAIFLVHLFSMYFRRSFQIHLMTHTKIYSVLS